MLALKRRDLILKCPFPVCGDKQVQNDKLFSGFVAQNYYAAEKKTPGVISIFQ